MHGPLNIKFRKSFAYSLYSMRLISPCLKDGVFVTQLSNNVEISV